MKNIRVFLSENFQFLEVKFSVYWNRRVFVMIFIQKFYLSTGSLCYNRKNVQIYAWNRKNQVAHQHIHQILFEYTVMELNQGRIYFKSVCLKTGSLSFTHGMRMQKILHNISQGCGHR